MMQQKIKKIIQLNIFKIGRTSLEKIKTQKYFVHLIYYLSSSFVKMSM